MKEQQNFLVTFLQNNAWAIIIVTASVVAQWSIFGTRLTNVEQRQDRQGQSITALQQSDAQQQANYAALSAKLDAVSDNVLYIRNRIDGTR